MASRDLPLSQTDVTDKCNLTGSQAISIHTWVYFSLAEVYMYLLTSRQNEVEFLDLCF